MRLPHVPLAVAGFYNRSGSYPLFHSTPSIKMNGTVKLHLFIIVAGNSKTGLTNVLTLESIYYYFKYKK